MPTLMLLGNCVAQRLERLVEACATGEGSAGHGWRVLRATPVYQLSTGPSPDEALAALAAQARGCDLVFSQPLFHYGPCNTEELRARLGDRLRLFAAPNFEAYFPDVLEVAPREPARFAPPLDWHSRIFVQCRAAGLPPEESGAIYLTHPCFREKAVAAALERTWRTYERREQGLDIGTLAVARRWYRREPLFHTWNHPAERLLAVLLDGILAELGMAADARGACLRRVGWNGGPLDAGDEAGERKEGGAPCSAVPATAGNGTDDDGAVPPWSFGFNSWPIITRHHRLFGFPGREWFRVAGTRVDLSTMALAGYTWYDLHPRTFAAAVDAVRARPEPGR
ncbi:WcbI family polysaccharide biosynthesis putative acetyltransferase [uncultured Desulfovibrio sp.]|uniref:WcbI family polysaccharide biosynthesis putative acetyltransferase n=1 Tax=uncultured Desulfovibrio sp. TaxID=167968 RepID=UPI00263B0252|nr:WcbI family polysaccharide biosynthesis putative acetyltransferase [uncultured Desulfovibrio sp.]